MRSYTAPGAPGRCPRCLLLASYCLCESVGAAQPSQPAIVIVRHHWETRKSTGTARLAGLALSNLRIIDMAAENPEPVRAELAALPGAWLLYPGAQSPGAQSPGAQSPGAQSPVSPAASPQTLVVLDGTWRQTRKMLRRLPELWRLPRLSLDSLPPDAARSRLREPPRPGARSTLESIADALAVLDSPTTGQRLLELHALFVRQTLLGRARKPAVGPNSTS